VNTTPVDSATPVKPPRAQDTEQESAPDTVFDTYSSVVLPRQMDAPLAEASLAVHALR